MKIMRHAGKTIFVMSGNGTQCPRMSMVNASIKLRDDYKGSFKTTSRLLKRIVSG